MTEGIIPFIGEPKRDFSPIVTHVRGTVKGNHFDTREGDGWSMTECKFDLTDIQVIKSRDPYPFPTYTFGVPYPKNPENTLSTEWSNFTASFRSVVPMTAYAGMNNPLDVLNGKVCEFKYDEASLNKKVVDEEGNDVLNEKGKRTYANQPGLAWKLVSAEGFMKAGGPTLSQTIADWFGVEGKPEKAFRNWFLAGDMSLKAFPDYNDAVGSDSERTLLPTFVMSGVLKDCGDGVYAKA